MNVITSDGKLVERPEQMPEMVAVEANVLKQAMHIVRKHGEGLTVLPKECQYVAEQLRMALQYNTLTLTAITPDEADSLLNATPVVES